jgi:UDPglucose 6-dehydrogenase
MSTVVATNGSTRIGVVKSAPPQQSQELGQIAIIGTGYVGLVTGTCLAELGNSVVCLDNDAKKIEALRRGELPFFEPQLHDLIVCNRDRGRLAFSEDVEAGVRDSRIVFIAVVAATIGRELNGPKIVVLKSTVPVKTNELIATIIVENAVEPHRVDVVSNPEFLCEGSAVSDFMYPDRVVIGTAARAMGVAHCCPCTPEAKAPRQRLPEPGTGRGYNAQPSS